MTTLRIGLSTCPNDTFVFHALLSGIVRVDGIAFEPVFEDIEKLNHLCCDDLLDASKVSFHAYGYLRERYTLLHSGAALGRGCGPLLVSRRSDRPLDLAGARIAIPGRLTSACLLLRLYAPQVDPAQLVEMTFDRILGAVASGDVDLGLIIHESRFTYAQYDLAEVEDLGRWWEEAQGQPIPLGGIIAHRRLGPDIIRRIDAGLRASVRHALEHPADSRDFVRAHAQELSEEVARAHIELYVNRFTLELGDEGKAAVDHLLRIADERGIFDSP